MVAIALASTHSTSSSTACLPHIAWMRLLRLFACCPHHSHAQVVIFVKSVQRAKTLNALLNECNFPSVCIYAGMPQDKRLDVYRNFKDNQVRTPGSVFWCCSSSTKTQVAAPTGGCVAYMSCISWVGWGRSQLCVSS
jgi:hypothetical protein